MKHFRFHKQLKEITNTFKRTSIIKTTKNNKILTNLEEIYRIWKEYIRDLFDDARSETSSSISNILDSPIMKSEMVYTLSKTERHNRRGQYTHGHTQISEDWKTLPIVSRSVTPTDCCILADCLISIFVAISKKPNDKACKEYRLISFMNHFKPFLIL
jgi:hypothetical protein